MVGSKALAAVSNRNVRGRLIGMALASLLLVTQL